jgi:hypothetical protein
MNLLEALEPNLPARIAIVGGGGKTTTCSPSAANERFHLDDDNHSH